MYKLDEYWENVDSVAATVTDNDKVIVTIWKNDGEVPGFALDVHEGQIRIVREWDK